VLSPQDHTTIRTMLAEIDAMVAEHQAELTRLAQLRATVAATVKHHTGMTNAALGAVLGVSGARAGELARAGQVFTGRPQ
jgi:hypothetical protein